LEREIITLDNEKFFKSGIGDLDDLKILNDYNRTHEENFQVDLTLTGKTLENDTHYPKLDVDYQIEASGTRKVEKTSEPADYNFDILYQPNFKAFYRLYSIEPVNNTNLDEYIGETSVKKDEGNKQVINIENEPLNRRIMSFTHNEKMVTKERCVYYAHRYSDYNDWQKLENTSINNDEGNYPSYNIPQWSFDRRSGLASVNNNNYYFNILTSSEGIFRNYQNFTISADIGFFNYISTEGFLKGLVGLSFCIQDSNNFYFAIVLFKVINGTKTILSNVDDCTDDSSYSATSALTILSGYHKNRNIRVDILENTVKVYINNNLVIEYEDNSRINTGGFGFSCYRTEGVTFNNVIFDRYIILENSEQDDFLKYGDTNKQLSSDNFDVLFEDNYNSRILTDNVETNWSNWYQNNKMSIPKRKDWTFNNTDKNLNQNYTDEDTYSIDTDKSPGEEWISPWSRDNTYQMYLSITEYGHHYIIDGGWYSSDTHKWSFKVDYNVYYQQEGETEWHYYTRKRSTENIVLVIKT